VRIYLSASPGMKTKFLYCLNNENGLGSMYY
jgi:hypothetical protein